MAGKRFWAILIKQALISLVIVFLAGLTFDCLTNDEAYRSPITAGALAILGYFAITAILGILHALSQALYLWLFSGDDMVASIIDDLRASRLPPPKRSHPKNYDYIEQLANDEEALVNDRVRAAVLVGGYNAAMAQGLFRSLALRKALDQAILRYAQEAPVRE